MPDKKQPEKPATEVVKALKVEVNFPSISGLKQTLGMTSEGEFQIGIQFIAKVNPVEVFRLVNMLKQPHSGLYAIIGTAQGALDFKFDEKAYKMEVIQAVQAAAQIAAPATQKGKASPEKAEAKDNKDKVEEAVVVGPPPSKFLDVRWDHNPEESKPFGLFATYLIDGNEKDHSIAGRGTSPTEAAMSLLVNMSVIPNDRKVEPFEAIKYLIDGYPKDGYGAAIAKVLNTNTFDSLVQVKDQDACGTAEPKEKVKRSRKKKEEAGDSGTPGEPEKKES